MGLIQAAVGAIGGTLADQWKDFYTVPEGLAPTAALLRNLGIIGFQKITRIKPVRSRERSGFTVRAYLRSSASI